MSFKLKVFNFEAECFPEPQDQERTIPPMIKIVGYLNDTKLFELFPEMGQKVYKWKELANACEEKGLATGNLITVRQDVTEFTMEDSGHGNGGTLTIFIPSESCIDAFREAARITEEWINQ